MIQDKKENYIPYDFNIDMFQDVVNKWQHDTDLQAIYTSEGVSFIHKDLTPLLPVKFDDTINGLLSVPPLRKKKRN